MNRLLSLPVLALASFSGLPAEEIRQSEAEAGEISYAAFRASDGLRLVGSAATRGGVLRLTPAKMNQRGATWRLDKVAVRAGFETKFRFRITDLGGLGPGADGFAFVIQNNGPTALAGRGASGGFGLGYSPGEKNKPGIANSLAVFFDTFRNQEDLSETSISICTNGGRGQMRWPPPQLGINTEPRVELKDGSAHQVRIAFAPPVLSVYVDDHLEVRAAVDLGRMVDADGTAYVGFTASTGEGFETHEILDWQFRSASQALVTTSISFAQFDCLPGKSLCTPAAATIDQTAPGEYRVVLPAHLPWAAAIPNPQGLRWQIREPRGMACLHRQGEACGSPASRPAGSPGALQSRSQNGRIEFTIADRDPADNEGFYEFAVILTK